MSDLARMGAVELSEAYAAGRVSPVDAADAALAAIGRFDGEVNAMVLTDREGALASAHESAERWAAGTQLGRADGIPCSIKDMFLTRGWPTVKGSMLIDDTGPWEEDAPVVARLREGGAVVLGKNATPEFAWKGVTDSIRQGVTGNPWGAHLTPGGSSGGAATAVGLGMGTWSVGTDGGGSVRIPASFTGTVALKPTFGLVPMYPPSPYGTLAHGGPMTRSVADAALMMDVLTGVDSRDWFAMPTPRRSFLDGLDDGVAGVRVAFSPTLGLGMNCAEVDGPVRAAVDVLADAGAVVEEVDPDLPPLAELEHAFHTLWFTGAGAVLAAYGPDALDKVDPRLAEHVREHASDSAQDYLDAMAVRMDLGVRMGAFHERYDLLITPTLPVAAFTAGQDAPDGWRSQLWTSWTPYTWPFNMTMQPALSVPCGLTDDERPIGLQVVGARHADRLVLRAGRAHELRTDWHTRTPRLAR